MTGIAMGLNEITKIAMGGTEILKVSMGDTLVWPAQFEPIYEKWPALSFIQGFSIVHFGRYGVLQGNPQLIYRGDNDFVNGYTFSPYPGPPTTWWTGLPGAPADYEMAWQNYDGSQTDWLNPDLVTPPAFAPGVTALATVGYLVIRKASTGEVYKIMEFGSPIVYERPPQGILSPRVGSIRFMNDGRILAADVYHDPFNHLLGSWIGQGYSVRATFVSGDTEAGDTDPFGVWFNLGSPARPAQQYICRFSAENSNPPRAVTLKIDVRKDSDQSITSWWIRMATTGTTTSSISWTPIA
jgi:hypothetical protein